LRRTIPGPDPDALDDAVLVVAPPPTSIEPTYLGTIINDVLASPDYPTLPAPVTVQGTLLDRNGQPVAADLVFEAVAITDIVNGQPKLDTQSFELTRFVAVDPDAAGAYSVVLPPGEYRFDVRPRTMDHALAVLDLSVPVQLDPLRADVTLGWVQSVRQVVEIADGRPLASAIVEGLPIRCAQPASLHQTTSTLWCMPRPAQASTDASGIFQLGLDPGQYALRAEPPVDSRLPWINGPVVNVTSTSGGSGESGGFSGVPVPLSIGMQLLDSTGRNPLPNALVRAFRISTQGTAVELGQAVTDTTGRYEMYVAPPD
jgi:hypothetical protein